MKTFYFTRVIMRFPSDNSQREFFNDITDSVINLGGKMTYGLEEDLLETAIYYLQEQYPDAEFLGGNVEMEVDGKIVDWRPGAYTE